MRELACGDVVLASSKYYDDNAIEKVDICIVLNYLRGEIVYNDDNAIFNPVKDYDARFQTNINNLAESDESKVDLSIFEVAVQYICTIDKEYLKLPSCKEYIKEVFQLNMNKPLNQDRIIIRSGYYLTNLNYHLDNYDKYVLKSAMTSRAIKSLLQYLTTADNILDMVSAFRQTLLDQFVFFNEKTKVEDFEVGRAYVKTDTKAGLKTKRIVLCVQDKDIKFLTLKKDISNEKFEITFHRVVANLLGYKDEKVKSYLSIKKQAMYGKYKGYNKNDVYYATTIVIPSKFCENIT